MDILKLYSFFYSLILSFSFLLTELYVMLDTNIYFENMIFFNISNGVDTQFLFYIKFEMHFLLNFYIFDPTQTPSQSWPSTLLLLISESGENVG